MTPQAELSRESFLVVWNALPTEWEPAADEERLCKIGFAFKLAGIDWRSMEDLANLLNCLHLAGVVEVNENREVRRVSVREVVQEVSCEPQSAL
jgi:hypothetical protein